MWLWGVLFYGLVTTAAIAADHFILGIDFLDLDIEDHYYSYTSLNFFNFVFWLTIWPLTALSIKRFHDVGLSGWLYVLPYILTLILQELISLRALQNPDASLISLFAAQPIYKPAWVTDFVESLPSNIFVLFLAINIIIYLAMFVITLFIRGNYDDNRFGPDPLGD